MSQWTLWLRDIAGAPPMERPAALVSVLATEGVAPCAAGTRMLVGTEDVRGSLGGGELEATALEQARAILCDPPGSWRITDHETGDGCPGRARLLVEHVDPAALGWLREVIDATPRSAVVTTLGPGRIDRHLAADTMPVRISARGPVPGVGGVLVERITQRRRPLYLFGAGHVGQAVARHLSGLPFSLAWFDPREDLAGIDGLTIVSEEEIAACALAAPQDAAVAIITGEHALDYLLAHTVLTRAEPVVFVGMIGSGNKRERFLSQLARDGVSDEALTRLCCPIGLAEVHGREPDIIAISVLAQLLGLPPG
jgi:xanthine dehydrogenase accessory factor